MGDVLIEVLKYAGFAVAWIVGLLVLCFVLALVAEGASVVRRAATGRMRRRRGGRRHCRPSSRRPAPVADDSRWSCALLVDVDEASGTVTPRVQLRGSELPPRARLKIELVDDRDALRHRASKRLPVGAHGRDVALGSFGPPDGACLDDVLGWRWDVALEDGSGERVCWTERLRPLRGVNAEAEIDDGRGMLAEMAQDTQRALTPAEERLVRAIFGDDALMSDRREV